MNTTQHRQQMRRRRLRPRECLHVLFISCLFVGNVGQEGSVKGSGDDGTRSPAVSGRFYPGSRGELARSVAALLDAADPPRLQGDVVGLVAPHAGYVYSGAVAAAAFKVIEGRRYDTVVLMGSAHRVGFDGIAVDDSRAYRTPLGDVPVDVELAGRIIAAHPAIKASRGAHAQDHVLETQLPFLQTALEGFSIVPLLFGSRSSEAGAALAEALPRLLAGKRWLIVASTDLSHYPPYAQAREVDLKSVDAVLSMDPARLRQHIAHYEGSGVPNLQTVMCGSAALLTLLDVVRNLPSPRAAACLYANSGDVPAGDKSQVVGYAAIAFTAGSTASGDERPAAATAPPPAPAPPASALLSDSDKQWLLRLARTTLTRLARPPLQDTGDIPPALLQKRGAFVTLKKQGELRGCIGYIEPRAPLAETVRENTLNAALNDHRFPAVTAGETASLTIEISALTPLREISSHDQFITGQHGILLRKGNRSAVFLPQVAVEQGWDRPTTLTYLSLKAGLPPDGWKSGCVFYVFEAEVFHEGE